MLQPVLSSSEIAFVDALRSDPQTFVASLSARQRVAYHLWLATGDERLACVVFPEVFAPEMSTQDHVLDLGPLRLIHLPKGTDEFGLLTAQVS